MKSTTASAALRLLGCFLHGQFYFVWPNLRKFAMPFIKEALHKRKEAVVQALNEAKLSQEEAEKVRREYEEKLAGLEAEREAMRAQALESAQREKERILAEASRMAERARVGSPANSNA